MNVLIVTHYFPPLNLVASYRSRAFARDLANAGCKVFVITTKKKMSDGVLDMEMPDVPGLNITELEYRSLFFWKKTGESKELSSSSGRIVGKDAGILRQFFRRVLNNMGFLLDHQYFWINRAIRKGEEIVTSQKIDVIISTFSPMASHMVAGRLKKKFPGVKWIADYRDLWTLNSSIASKGVWNVLERVVEKSVLKRSNMLTTVSEPLKEELTCFFKGQKKVEVIYNGFETSLLNVDNFKHKPKMFVNRPIRITYTGTIYAGRRYPMALFEALHLMEQRKVIKRGDIVVDFYGSMIGNLQEVVHQAKAEHWVNINGHLPHAAISLIQKNSDLLLFLESGDANAKGVLTGKLFEYLISGRPVLALGIQEDSAAGMFIKESRTGVVLPNNPGVIADFLANILHEQKFSGFDPDISFITQYSRENQSKKLLNAIRELCNG